MRTTRFTGGSDFNDYLTVSNFCIDKVDVNMSEKKYNYLKETDNIAELEQKIKNLEDKLKNSVASN